MAPTTASATLSQEIDQLLEQYLDLIGQYTTLRSQLSALQSSVHQHISRANFSGERGIRYGADFYDARMQATRVCRITVRSSDGDTDTAPGLQRHEGQGGSTTAAAVQARVVKDGSTTSTAAGRALEGAEGWNEKEVNTISFTVSTTPRQAHEAEAEKEEEDDSEEMKTSHGPRDPIRMFGLLTPPSLRPAQIDGITTVEEIVPRLVSVDAAMREVEIRIRRGRKYMARAEMREEKEGLAVDVGGEGLVGVRHREEVV